MHDGPESRIPMEARSLHAAHTFRYLQCYSSARAYRVQSTEDPWVVMFCLSLQSDVEFVHLKPSIVCCLALFPSWRGNRAVAKSTPDVDPKTRVERALAISATLALSSDAPAQQIGSSRSSSTEIGARCRLCSYAVSPLSSDRSDNASRLPYMLNIEVEQYEKKIVWYDMVQTL